MDQKKTLWIIAAVGAFLLVILVPAFIMYPKAPKVEQTITRNLPEPSRRTPQTDDGWNEPVAVPNDIAVNDLTVFAENANVYGFDTSSDSSSGTTIDLNALRAENSPAVAPSQDINITVEIKEPEKQVVPADNYYVAKTEEKPVQKVTKVETKTVEPETKSNVTVKTPVKTTTTTKTSSKASVKVTTTAKPAAKTQFWVQVAAYSSKKTAENARAVLDANKITADIFTHKDAKGNLFYRVRVGPYTTKSEAEYWRSKIIKISEFSKAESYVTSTNTEL